MNGVSIMGLLMRILNDRSFLIALWTLGVVSGAFFPGTARAGFFDFLFGPPAVPEQQPYDAERVYRHRFSHGFHAHKPAARHKLALADKPDHPVRPLAPADIMDDPSLKRGDAVMTPAGIRIFVGYSGVPHHPEDFRKISEVKKLSQRERSALAALDTPAIKVEKQGADQGPAMGRSASEHKITAGETITDSNGRTVRYVGP
jgi:hypothetical protein